MSFGGAGEKTDGSGSCVARRELPLQGEFRLKRDMQSKTQNSSMSNEIVTRGESCLVPGLAV